MDKTALKHLNKIFSKTTKDSLSLTEIYLAVGLDLSKPAANRIWIGNRLAALKKHQFVEPIYELKNNSPVLTRVKLTAKGKSALTKVNQINNHSTQIENLKLSFEEIMKELTKQSQKHPNLRIEYSIKDEIVSVQRVQK